MTGKFLLENDDDMDHESGGGGGGGLVCGTHDKKARLEALLEAAGRHSFLNVFTPSINKGGSMGVSVEGRWPPGGPAFPDKWKMELGGESPGGEPNGFVGSLDYAIGSILGGSAG